MTQTDESAGEPSELGALLELLHRAGGGVDTVRATYRIWRHEDRAHDAYLAEVEDDRRRVMTGQSLSFGRAEPGPVEHEERLRVWRAGDRLREERDGGPRAGFYGVRVGTTWWQWDEGHGAVSNEDDPRVGNSLGEELSTMLDPAPLLAALSFTVLGRSRRADRATITAAALPRPRASRQDLPRRFELHRLGSGADRYVLEIDRELGVLLAVTALFRGEPFHEIETLDIAFGEAIPGDVFEFTAPAGEEVRPVGQWPRPEHVPLTTAQQRAPFTVLMPARVPADWRLHCIFLESYDRPPRPAQVSLHYRSDSGHESLQLAQTATGDRPSIYDDILNGDGRREVERAGTTIQVNEPVGQEPAEAHVEIDGTSVLLTSETLGIEELIRIAAGLRPAPDVGEI